MRRAKSSRRFLSVSNNGLNFIWGWQWKIKIVHKILRLLSHAIDLPPLTKRYLIKLVNYGVSFLCFHKYGWEILIHEKRSNDAAKIRKIKFQLFCFSVKILFESLLKYPLGKRKMFATFNSRSFLKNGKIFASKMLRQLWPKIEYLVFLMFAYAFSQKDSGVFFCFTSTEFQQKLIFTVDQN